MVDAAFTGFQALPPAAAKRHWRDVLGVGPNAWGDEVEEAYRRLAKEHHPDRNPGDDGATQRFLHLQEAYEAYRRERGT